MQIFINRLYGSYFTYHAIDWLHSIYAQLAQGFQAPNVCFPALPIACATGRGHEEAPTGPTIATPGSRAHARTRRAVPGSGVSARAQSGEEPKRGSKKLGTPSAASRIHRQRAERRPENKRKRRQEAVGKQRMEGVSNDQHEQQPGSSHHQRKG